MENLFGKLALSVAIRTSNMARATGTKRKHGGHPADLPAQGKRSGCTLQKAPTAEEKKSRASTKPKAKGRGCTRSTPWNKGVRQTKTSKQHLFIPRDQIPLFLAVALYWAGPKYACVLWLTLVTSRRISETLLLRGTDIRVQGGEDHDAGHILFQRRPQDDNLGGSGKLGSEEVVARLSKDAIAAIQQLCTDGLEHELRPVLEPFKVAAPLIFQMKPLNKDRFQLDTGSHDFVFATASKKKGCRPNMSKAKCFGRSQGGEENYVSNHWEPEVQPGNEISRQQGDSARSYQTHER